MAIRKRNTSPDPVERYARDVLADRIIAGRPVKLACERHLRDLVDGPKRGLYWDTDSALWVIGYFRDVLRLNGGGYEGQPFILAPPQAFIVGSLFGWKGADGYRRFRTAYVEQGKGGGKSPMAAGIGIYMMTADREPRAEIYSAAVDKAQAAILFRDAVAMVDQSPTLDKRVQRSGGEGRVWNLADLSSGSFFRPISSERKGRGKSGPRPHCALLDEVHEHPSNAMVEFMRAGTKGRLQALIAMFTNSGFDRQSVCYQYHDYGIKLLTGQEENNDAFFAYICSLDSCDACWAQGYVQPNPECSDCDDWRNPAVWMKANPLLGITPTVKYLEEQVRDAIGMPSKQAIVRRLNFCEWTESATPFIGADLWKANGAKPSEEALRKYPVAGALDLSGKNALTALVIGCQDDMRKVHVKPYAWTPEKGLRERQERDGAPYARWVEEKHLKTTPGATIDFDFVAAELARIHADYNLHGLAFDRWRIEEFQRSCQKVGLEAWIEGTDDPIPGGLRLVPHGQGFKDMGPAIDHLEDDLKETRLCHGNHPVLTMCVANCTTETDAAGLRKFSKARSTGRIDLAQALAMVETVIKSTPVPKEKTYQAYFF